VKRVYLMTIQVVVETDGDAKYTDSVAKEALDQLATNAAGVQTNPRHCYRYADRPRGRSMRVKGQHERCPWCGGYKG